MLLSGFCFCTWLHFFYIRHTLDYFKDLHSVPDENPSNLQYNIKLPVVQSTLLTALQHNRDNGVYANFDLDTEYCVVNSCANIHIWNDLSAYIPESYLKLNTAASTSVSVVNGDSNLPASSGRVPVE